MITDTLLRFRGILMITHALLGLVVIIMITSGVGGDFDYY